MEVDNCGDFTLSSFEYVPNNDDYMHANLPALRQQLKQRQQHQAQLHITTTFQQLPAEALWLIMSMMAGEDVARLRMTCKVCYSVGSDNDLWKHLFKRRWSTYPVKPDSLPLWETYYKQTSRKYVWGSTEISALYKRRQQLTKNGTSLMTTRWGSALNRDTGEKVAIKILPNDSEGIPTRFVRTLKILKELSHSHIMSVQNVCLDNCNPAVYRRCYIIYDFVELSLQDILQDEKQVEKIDEAQCVRWLSQLLSALVYLHDNDIVHRAVKPSHILITSDMNVKLTGFESATHASEGFVEKSCFSLEASGTEVDMWALGSVCYSMLWPSGMFPDIANYKYQVALEHVKTDGPFSPGARHFMSQLLCEPSLRLTARQAQQHPFITQYSKTS